MISRHLRKLLPATLVFTIAFSSIPFTKINAFAETNSTTEKEAAESYNKQVYEQNAKKIVAPPAKEDIKEGEVTSLSTEDSKTIYNGDGEYEKQIYTEPIQHQNEEKKWEPISTNLEAKTSEDIIEPVNTNINVSFDEKMENGEYATFKFNDNSVQYSFLGGVKEEQLITPQALITPTFEKNKITFPNVIENVDIRNIIFNNLVKEDILLKKYDGINTFKFLMKTSLKASLDETNNIIFKDNENNIVGQIPAPKMSDSNQNNPGEEPAVSYDISYELKEVPAGYELFIIADDEWLKSTDRIYPVYLDPTTITYDDKSTQDTYVESGMPDNNYNATWDSAAQKYWLRTGYYNSTVGTFYSFVKMPLDKLKGANLTDARLRLYTGYAYYPESSTAVYADKVNGPWNESTLTWNNKPSSTNITFDSVKEGEWTNLDVTDTVKSFVANPSTNYGFKLHTNSSTIDRFKKFNASENNDDKVPYVHLTYNYPQPVKAPAATAVSHNNGKNEGYINFSWDKVADATGYILSFYTGSGYKDIVVSNDADVTSWSTKDKKIWPTPTEINNAYKSDNDNPDIPIHSDNSGVELPQSAATTYQAAGNEEYGHKPYYFVRLRVMYAGGVSDMSVNAATPIIPLEKPKGAAKANPTDPNTGYTSFTWSEDPAALGYYVKVFNGMSYDTIDVGTDTSYTTQGEKIWPTDTEADYHIHTDHLGAELAKDPSVVYRRSGTTIYQNAKNYWFRVIAYYDQNKTLLSPLSTEFAPTIPPQAAANSLLGTEDTWTLPSILGEQVNAVTGNFIYAQNDFTLPSKSFSVDTQRTYNSQSTSEGIFGLGWTSPYEINIKEDSNGNILFTDEDGTVHTYDKVTMGTVTNYVTPVGQYRDIEKNASGYVLTNTNDNVYTFDTSGKLTKIEEMQQLDSGSEVVKNSLSFNYSNSKLSTISLNGTNKATYTYGSNGKVQTITSVTGEGNKVWTYGYTSNLLSSVTDPLNKVIRYEYTSNILTGIREPNDTTAKPYLTTFGYTNGKLTSVKDAKNNTMSIVYDSGNKKVTVTDFKGTPTEYYYDEYLNSLKEVIDPNGLNITSKTEFTQSSNVNTTDPNGNNSSTINDDEGNATNITEDVDSNEELTTCNEYDENNNLTKQISDYDTSSSTSCADKGTPSDTDDSQDLTIDTYEDENNVSSVNSDITSSVSEYYTDGTVKRTTKNLAPSNNMVINSGIENSTLTNWTWITSSNGTGTYSLQKFNVNNINDPANLNIKSGQQGVKIKPSVSTNAAGYHILKQVIDVEKDTNYTLSGYIKTNNLTNGKAFFNIAENSTDKGDGTTLKYTDSLNSPVKGNEDWTRRTINFKTTSNTESILIYLEVTNSNDQVSGEAYFDNIQLEKSETTSEYNPVENSSFEKLIDNWTITNPCYISDPSKCYYSLDTDDYYEGKQSLNITKSYQTSPVTTLSQILPVYQKKAGEITVTGMSKAFFTKFKSNGTYNINIKVNYMDTNKPSTNEKIEFKKGSHDWQRDAITIDSTDLIKSLEITLSFGGSVGTVWFDNIKVLEGQIWTSYDYDSNGFMIKSTNPLDTIVSSTYDSLGNQLTSTDGEGVTRSFTYDSLGKLETAKLPNKTKAVYHYDDNGNMTEKLITNEDGSVVYNKTVYSYNELNQLVSVKDPLNKESTTTFDANGNIESITTPNGKTITNIYDKANRLTDLKVGSTTWHTFQYDKNGNITKTTDSHSGQVKEFSYDASNQLINQKVDGITTDWIYNNGQLMTVKLQGETNGIAYFYDNADNNTQIKDNESKIYRFGYNDSGTLNNYISPDGTASSSLYDQNDRTTNLIISKGIGSIIAGYEYKYDKRDNITMITNDNGQVINYSYDSNNQLLSEDIPASGTNVAYKYDAVGNRIEKKVTGSSNTTATYEYNAANQLTKVDGQTYTYDNNGNLTNDGKFIYTWDELNNLTMVKKVSDNSEVAVYKYDDQNRRIYKKVGSKITKYVYNGDSILPIYETDNGGTLTYKYIYNADDKLVARYDVISGKKYYYQQNAHGDIVAVTDDTGTVVASYVYDAWGNVVSKSGSYADDNPIRYAGYYFDSETGLYYLIARYYNSLNGNFISLDPLPGDESNLSSQNGYNYAINNPISYVDPDGNKFIDRDGSDTFELSLQASNGLLGAPVEQWHPGHVTSTESLLIHYGKHGNEVKADTAKKYLNKAIEFRKTAKKGVKPSKVNGFTPGVKRWRKSGKYIDLAPDGRIVSFGKT